MAFHGVAHTHLDSLAHINYDGVFYNGYKPDAAAAVGPWEIGRNGLRPGPSGAILPWLKARDVALLGSDVLPTVVPSDVEGPTGPVHDFALVTLGVHLFDNCDLEALAEAAAARKRWEFLLTVAPLPIRGGTGSPVNPIATLNSKERRHEPHD